MAKEVADKVEREKRKTERDLEDEHGGAGVYSASLKNNPPRRSKSRGRKRERSAGMDIDGDAMDMDDEKSAKKKLRTLSRPRSRSRSRPPTQVIPGEGLRDSHQKGKAIKKAYKSVKNRNKNARKGEADRTILNLRPKHLLPGKRSTGKTDPR